MTVVQAVCARRAWAVVLETRWTPDEDANIRSTAIDPVDWDDWKAWEAEVRATTIVGGVFYAGAAYMGGTWVEIGSSFDPEINGYEPQMTVEALKDLLSNLPVTTKLLRRNQIEFAIHDIKNMMTHSEIQGPHDPV